MNDDHIILDMLSTKEVKFTLYEEEMRLDCEFYDDTCGEWYLVAQVVPDLSMSEAINILLIGRDTKETHHICLALNAEDVSNMLTHYSRRDIYLPPGIDDIIDSWKLIRRMSKCE